MRDQPGGVGDLFIIGRRCWTLQGGLSVASRIFGTQDKSMSHANPAPRHWRECDIRLAGDDELVHLQVN